MPAYKEFALPDLGEGLTEGEILNWLVAVGDEVRLNQPIVEVETAKAAVEIPSPYAGVVTTLHHEAGETVDVGTPIITIDTDPGGAAEQASPSPTASPIQGGDLVPEAPRLGGAAEEPVSVLVGSGPKRGRLTRRARKPKPAQAAPAAPAAVAGRPSGVRVLAKPPVRKLARDLGVDLRLVGGTGPDGAITRSDVQAALGAPAPAGPPQRVAPAIDFDPGTREQRLPIKGVRKLTAAAMVQSAFTAPHVSEFITVDVTPAVDLVDRLRSHPDFADTKVSPLLLVAHALLQAVQRHPLINATWDDAAQEIVVKGYVNLGIAAATPRGLIVPNIKDAARLALPDLARALDGLVATARSGRTAPADMAGGTITITNVGVFGVDTGTPILNPGEAAILCFGAIRDTPWVHDGRIAIRKVTQLGLSFDHRMVDGQLGSEFLADVAGMLADPWRLVDWRAQ